MADNKKHQEDSICCLCSDPPKSNALLHPCHDCSKIFHLRCGKMKTATHRTGEQVRICESCYRKKSSSFLELYTLSSQISPRSKSPSNLTSPTELEDSANPQAMEIALFEKLLLGVETRLQERFTSFEQHVDKKNG